MPRATKPFSQYPGWILSIIQRMYAGEKIVQLPAADRGAAVSSVQMFNRGRQQFVREATRHGSSETELRMAEAALDIIARYTNLKPQHQQGEYIIEFIPRGYAILADESRGTRRGMISPLRGEPLVVPGLGEPQREAQQSAERNLQSAQHLDDHDRQLADLMGIDLDLIIAEGRKRALSELSVPGLGDGQLQAECSPGEHEADIYGLRCVKCNAKLSA